MSFTTEVKDELSRVEGQCKICDQAMLSALVKSQGTLKFSGSGNYSVEFTTDNAWIARFALQNFRELYNLEAVLTFRRNVMHNNHNYLIELLQGDNLIDALIDLGILEKVDSDKSSNYVKISYGVKPQFLAKDCCSSAYLRGAFLGGGYISEPKGDFHFEISVENEDQANDLMRILKEKGIRGGICQRRNSYLYYIKGGQSIADFLAFTGAHKCALKMENVRVKKNISNQINRQTNAEMANSKRSVDAAYNQLIMIKKVVETYGFEHVPESIRQFMALRVRHRNESLSELGRLSNPPLSKSTISSRVRRLEEMYRSIQDTEDKEDE